MKLYLNLASPYARLVRAVLIETGLDDETELVLVDPWQSDATMLDANPASKVPALALDDGTTVVESACIADYLIQRAGRPDMSPLGATDPARSLQVLGLGRAAIDCAFGSVIQQRSAPGSALVARWQEALPRIAAALDPLVADSDRSGPDLSDVTVAVAFEYVDFRLGEIGWHSAAPRLAAHVGTVGQRRSLAETRPE